MASTPTAPALTGSPLERSDYLRGKPADIEALRQRPDAKILPLSRGNPILNDQTDMIVLPHDHPFVDGAELIFLGLNGETPWFAAPLGEVALPAGMEVMEARTALFAGLVEGENAAILAAAKALANWHHLHPRCSRCGDPTAMSFAGWRRDCPSCGAQHFPRTDPVVIMLIINGERCAIARNVNFPDKLYSCIAGFVEPGETIEEAVARETVEELGLRTTRVAYVSSQPWPFPASLMLGCIAETADTEFTLEIDEIADARWLTRAELKAMFDGEISDMEPPRRGAIARDLALDWLEGRIGF